MVPSGITVIQDKYLDLWMWLDAKDLPIKFVTFSTSLELHSLFSCFFNIFVFPKVFFTTLKSQSTIKLNDAEKSGSKSDWNGNKQLILELILKSTKEILSSPHNLACVEGAFSQLKVIKTVHNERLNIFHLNRLC